MTNSVNYDQMSQNAISDQNLHCSHLIKKILQKYLESISKIPKYEKGLSAIEGMRVC